MTTRARLAAAAFAGHAAARELLGEQAMVHDDAVTSEGTIHRGRIAREDSAELLLQPGSRRFPQRSVTKVEREAARWLGDCAEAGVWALDLEHIGREALARACVAAARLVLPRHEAVRPDDPTARDAVEAAEAWLREGTPDREAAAREAAVRAEDRYRRRGPSADWSRRLLERARAEGLDVAGLEAVDPEYWISVLEDQLGSLPEEVCEAAWLACADAAWSCTSREAWPLRVLHLGLLHQAASTADPAEVRKAIDAALLPWGLGDSADGP